MSCNSIVRLMHEYLDGELDSMQEMRLKKHIVECEPCYKHLIELEKSIALVQSLSHIRVRDDFSQQVLAMLPKEQTARAFAFRIKKHPFLVAASLFFLLMMGSTLFSWYGDEKLQVLSANSHSLVIQDGKVYVPEGEVIEGDLIVKNGDIQVNGEVKGSVVAIDGNVVLASTAHITGEAEEIHQILDWIWYKIKSFGKVIVAAH